MATLGDINTKISNLLGVDTNTYSNASRLIDINLSYQKIITMILDSQDEVDFDDSNNTTYPNYTFPLTTNRDYSFDSTLGLLKIKYLSLSYDGVNYYKATAFDDGELENMIGIAPAAATTANTTLDGLFSRYNPRYDYKNGSVFIYPLATSTDVANGATAYVEFYRAPIEFTLSDLTTGTISPGFDPSFHMMLAYATAYEYAFAQKLSQAPQILSQLQDYEIRLRRQYSSKQLDRRYSLNPDYENMK